MKRSEFMAQLEKLLSDISENERKEALQYYNDYFNDAGEENEDDVIKALGTPEQVAKTVKEGLGEAKPQGEFTEQGYSSDTSAANKNEIVKTENAETDNKDSKNAEAPKKPKKQLPTWATVLIIVGSLVLVCLIITVFMVVRAVKVAKHMAVVGGQKVEEVIEEVKPYIEDVVGDVKNNIPGNISGYIGALDGSNNGEIQYTDTMEFDASTIKKLDIKFGVGSLIVKQKEERDAVIEVRSAGFFNKTFEPKIDGDTLVISINESAAGNKIASGLNGFNTSVEILLPHGFRYDEAVFELGGCNASVSELSANELKVSVGAGSLNMNTIVADNLELEIGAGEATANMVVNNADIEVGMGNLDFSGYITGNMKLDCGMGAANFDLSESMTDHNYNVDSALGAVVIGNESFKSVDKKHIDNNASSEYDIECGVGAVNIRFKE